MGVGIVLYNCSRKVFIGQRAVASAEVVEIRNPERV